MTSLKLICVLVFLALANIDPSLSIKQSVYIDDDIYHAWQHLRGVFGSIGDFFGHQVGKLQDLWSDGTEALTTKVDDTVSFLQTVKDNQVQILNNAKAQGNKKLQEAVHNAGQYLEDAKAFQQRMREQAVHKVEDFSSQASDKAHEVSSEASMRYHQLANDWQTKTTGWWNGGLETLADWAHFLQLNQPQPRPFYKRVFGSIAMTVGVSLVLLGLVGLAYTQRATIYQLYNKHMLHQEGHQPQQQSPRRPIQSEERQREGDGMRYRERRHDEE